jgi:hypothetical protein
MLSFHNMNLAVFRGEDPGGVLWQPRLEYWYNVNKRRGTLPEPLKEATLLDLYDYCHASVRYFTKPLGVRYKNVQVTEWWEDEKRLRSTWETPVGMLTDVICFDEWLVSGYHTEYKLKTPRDLQTLEFILQDEEWTWDQEAYEQDLHRIGERGCPQFYFRRSPIQGLFIEHMGFEASVYLMHDHPALVRHYVQVASEADDAMYDLLAQCPVQILNLGENIDAFIDSPPIWREHLAPYYRRRVDELHAAGKFVHIHVDGAMKPLLKHLRDCPWNGIEAATAFPQGDVTLEEIKEAVGDLILLDGLPALYFLPDQYSIERLVERVNRVIDLFHPRLVLGISDELPPDGDIERVRLVGQLVQEGIERPTPSSP